MSRSTLFVGIVLALTAERAAAQSAFVDQNAHFYLHIRPADVWSSDVAAKLRQLYPKHAEELARELDFFKVARPDEIESITLVGQSTESIGGLLFAQPKPAAKGKGPPAGGKDFDDKKGATPDFKDKGLEKGLHSVIFQGDKKPYWHDKGEFLLFSAGVKIVTLAKPYDKAKLMKTLLPGEVLERQVKGKSYFVSEQSYPFAVHFVDERTVMMATPALWLEKLLAAPPTKSGPLAGAIALAAQKHHLVLGFNFEEKTGQQFKKRLGEEFERPGDQLPTWLLTPLLTASSATLAFDVAKEGKAQAELRFANANQAQRAHGAAEDAIHLIRMVALGQMQKELRVNIQDGVDNTGVVFVSLLLRQLEEGLRGVKVTRDQATLRAVATVPLDVAALTAKIKVEMQEIAADEPARQLRIRRASVNNLKNIGLSLHGFHDANKALPPAAICSVKDGKPLLSWRVLVLPYLDDSALFNEFKLDEAWDSAHNIKLLPRMPKYYATPGVKTKEPYTTYYRALVGPDAIFKLQPNPKLPYGAEPSLRFVQVTDGTSNTIGIVEARDAVPWTKPDELMYDAKKPLPPMGGTIAPGGFNASFMDATVRFVPLNYGERSIRAFITPAGGETVTLPD